MKPAWTEEDVTARVHAAIVRERRDIIAIVKRWADVPMTDATAAQVIAARQIVEAITTRGLGAEPTDRVVDYAARCDCGHLRLDSSRSCYCCQFSSRDRMAKHCGGADGKFCTCARSELPHFHARGDR